MDTAKVLRAAKNQRLGLHNPPKTASELLETILFLA
jgi:hypothetical protein